MIRVLVADDDRVAQALLVRILDADPNIRVVRVAEDGQAAVDAVHSTDLDLVVMDINMPRMNGFDATRQIMASRALPIVMVSGTEQVEDALFECLDAGALTVLVKPGYPGDPLSQELAAELVQTVKLMSEVKVVTRRPPRQIASVQVPAAGSADDPRLEVLAIGASTGGPPILRTILDGLPQPFPVPILIVQHIASGFLTGLIDWLKTETGLDIHVGAHQERMQIGHVYMAPDDYHMGVAPSKRIILSRDELEFSIRPAVNYLFRSVAATYGPRAAGVLLSGMGQDGAQGLRLLRDKGALTIAQDKATSVVFGMPAEAIKLNAAQYILPPEKIVAKLTHVFR